MPKKSECQEMGLYSITLDDIISSSEAPRCHVPNTAPPHVKPNKQKIKSTIPYNIPHLLLFCPCPMSFSSRRRNYLLTPHRRDGLIEWYVCMFVSRVVVNNVMM